MALPRDPAARQSVAASTFDSGRARRTRNAQAVVGAGTPYAKFQQLLNGSKKQAQRNVYQRISDPLIRQSVFLSQQFPRPEDQPAAKAWLAQNDVRKGGRGAPGTVNAGPQQRQLAGGRGRYDPRRGPQRLSPFRDRRYPPSSSPPRYPGPLRHGPGGAILRPLPNGVGPGPSTAILYPSQESGCVPPSEAPLG